MGIFTRENIKATQAAHDHQSSEESGLTKKDIGTRITLPTGETGTLIGISPDGNVQISLDSKPGEEDRIKFAGDPEKTEIVDRLLEVPPEKRDSQWEEAFLANVVDANMDGGPDLQPKEIEGPDGFPYIRLDSPELNKPYRAWVIRHILPNLMEHALGVVINLEKGQPDWVFSFGDIVNLHLNGAFKSDDKRFEKYDPDAPDVEETREGQVQVIDPPPDILPPQVRAVLRRFLKAYGFPPKVMMIYREADPEMNRKGGLSLVFALTDEIIRNEQNLNYVYRAVPWFLPRYYSVLWMKESENFFEL